MTEVTVKAPDLVRLERIFKEMEWKKQKRLVRACFRKALNPVLSQSKANVPKGRTRNLYTSLGLLFQEDKYKAVLGARKFGRFKGYHGHLVEDGTVDRQWRAKRTMKMFNRKTGTFYTLNIGDVQKTGKMNPNGRYAGFLRKAVRSEGQAALQIMGDEFFKGIDKYHRKNGLR